MKLLLLLLSISFVMSQCSQKTNDIKCKDISVLTDIDKTHIDEIYEKFEIIGIVERDDLLFKSISDSILNIKTLFESLRLNKNEKSIEDIKSSLESLPVLDYTLKNEFNELKEKTTLKVKSILKQPNHSCNEFIVFQLYDIEKNFLLDYLSPLKRSYYRFNKATPHVTYNSNKIQEGDSIKLNINFIATDTSSTKKIIYWIDNPEMNPGLAIEHRSNNPIYIGGTKGKHKVYGKIMVNKKGVKNYMNWSFDYIIN